MRAKELEVSHPSNPPNPDPEPEAPQPSKGKNNSWEFYTFYYSESAETQKAKPEDKTDMEPKLDKSPVKADNGNPPVDSESTDARISQLEEDNAKLLHMVNLIQGFL